MKRNVMCKLAVVLTVGTLALAAGEAKAQYIKYGPNGEVGIRNPLGTYTWIYPSRFNPGANVPVPGTLQASPVGVGVMWQGQDGLPHGTYFDDTTGDIVAYSTKKSSGFNGFLEEGKAPQAQAAAPKQGGVPHATLRNSAKVKPPIGKRNVQTYRPGFRSR